LRLSCKNAWEKRQEKDIKKIIKDPGRWKYYAKKMEHLLWP